VVYIHIIYTPSFFIMILRENEYLYILFVYMNDMNNKSHHQSLKGIKPKY